MLDVQISLQRTEGFRLRSDFRLERPVNGVFGPSGAGKTTLLHLIAGLEKSAEGSIRLQGHTLQDAARGVFIPAHKRRIGVVFQDARLFPHLSVMGNLRFALKRVRKHGRVPHVSSDDVIHLLELEPLLTRRPADLSGGEQRRVALARALLSAPRLLLLDEPLSGLHVALRREILGYLKAIQRHTAVPMLMVSHNIEEILALTDDMLLLKDGTVRGCGPYAQLLENPTALDALNAGKLTNLLSLKVQWHSSPEGLTYCHPLLSHGESTRIAGGGRLPVVKVPASSPLRTGQATRWTLSPDDVALSNRPQPGLGIDNQLRARVIRILDTTRRPLCLLDAGMRLLAEVSHDSIKKLRLTPDRNLWALFRSADLKST